MVECISFFIATVKKLPQFKKITKQKIILKYKKFLILQVRSLKLVSVG